MLITLGKIMTNLVQTHYTNRPILALAPGLQTGWAFSPGPGVIISSSWDLSAWRGDDAIRYQLLKNTFDEFWFLNEAKNFEVLFEQAHRIPGTQTCRAELLRPLKAWCLERGLAPPQPVGIGQIKKFWTGRGNVTTEDMVAEARARGFDPVDGNEAIALALLHWRVILGSSDDVALAA
jgi:hypothetical protein